MRARPGKTLLLLLLLVIAGQALAAPCASDIFAGLSLQTAPGETALCSGESAHHCDHSGENSGGSENCEQTCKCCPGHCATALPASDDKGSAPVRNPLTTSYSEINSSPLPEMALRPPIAR